MSGGLLVVYLRINIALFAASDIKICTTFVLKGRILKVYLIRKFFLYYVFFFVIFNNFFSMQKR